MMRNRTLLFSGLAALLFGLTGLMLSWNIALASTPTTQSRERLSAQATPTSSASYQPGKAGTNPFMGVSDASAPYDLRFIDEMIMHHQGAIMSSRMMIGDSKRPELRDLSRRIQEKQQRQIDQMRAWRKQWYPKAPEPRLNMDSMMSMMGGGMMGGGMMGGGMMGNDGGSDRMFLRMMIPHHQLAIDMAQDAVKNGQHAKLKVLAREIIGGQSAEITEMEHYLQKWYGEASTRGAAGEMRHMMQQMMGH